MLTRWVAGEGSHPGFGPGIILHVHLQLGTSGACRPCASSEYVVEVGVAGCSQCGRGWCCAAGLGLELGMALVVASQVTHSLPHDLRTRCALY